MVGDLPGVDAAIAARFRAQTWTLLRVMAAVIVLLAVVWVTSYYWVPIEQVEAQQTATPVASEVESLKVQIDEISKSQDRFQQSLLAVVTIVGTGLVALIGFNFVATNRNAALESDILREHAVLTADKAVTAAEARFDTIVATQGDRAAAVVNNLLPRADQHLMKHAEALGEALDKLLAVNVSALVEDEREKSERLLVEAQGLYAKAAKEAAELHAETVEKVGLVEYRMSQTLRRGFELLLEMTYLTAVNERRKAEQLIKDNGPAAADGDWPRVFDLGLRMVELASAVGEPAVEKEMHVLGLSFVLASLKGNTNRNWNAWANLTRLRDLIEAVSKDEKLTGYVSQIDEVLGEKHWRR